MQHLQPNTTLQGGKYRIERVLGQGGFGITYLARNTVFDIDVAIKEFFMKDENERDGSSVTMPNSTKKELFLGQKEKFKKEAKRMFAIKNEHIIGVHDLFEENGTAYYVMDYVDGENLSERLMHKGRPMPEQEVREIIPQILDALKSVHDAGIWHLDLKPGNVMIDKDGNAYLIDFGASKQIRANGNMTTSTALCYTPGYAPNEQIGQMYDRFGPWTDIYALGATIYNIITNKKPPMAIDIEEDGVEAFEFPQTISTDMRNLVIWMMQPKRKERPQSVKDVASKLNSLKLESLNVEPKIPQHLKPMNDESTLLSTDAYETHLTPKAHDVKREVPAGTELYVFENGAFSDREWLNGLQNIGVVVEKRANYSIVASKQVPDSNSIIGGKHVDWHIATTDDWKKIIEKLGQGTCFTKTSSFFWLDADVVRKKLKRLGFDKEMYIALNGTTNKYCVNLKSGYMPKVIDGIDMTNEHYIYIAEI